MQFLAALCHLPKEVMQFLSMVCAAGGSSGAVKEMSPYDASRIFAGLVLSTALSCSVCNTESLVCRCCFLLLSQQTSPWISVNLTSAVGGDYCHKLTEVLQV